MKEIVVFLLILVCFSGCERQEIKVIREGVTALHRERPEETKEIDKPVISPAVLEVNPFLTPEEREYFRYKGRPVIEDLQLSAIFYSPLRRRVIIDSQILEEGDRINNKRIVQILEEGVVLRDEEDEYILKLRGVLP